MQKVSLRGHILGDAFFVVVLKLIALSPKIHFTDILGKSIIIDR